MPEHQS